MEKFNVKELMDDVNIETITEEQNDAIIEKCTNVDNNDRLDEFVDFLQELLEKDEEEA